MLQPLESAHSGRILTVEELRAKRLARFAAQYEPSTRQQGSAAVAVISEEPQPQQPPRRSRPVARTQQAGAAAPAAAVRQTPSRQDRLRGLKPRSRGSARRRQRDDHPASSAHRVRGATADDDGAETQPLSLASVLGLLEDGGGGGGDDGQRVRTPRPTARDMGFGGLSLEETLPPHAQAAQVEPRQEQQEQQEQPQQQEQPEQPQ